MGKREPMNRAIGPVLGDDMYDDAELYNRNKELAADNVIHEGEAEIDESEGEEVGVMDIDSGGSEGEEYDSDDDLTRGGKLAKIVAAERAVKRSLALKSGLDGDEEEGEEDEDTGLGWGPRKEAYYDAEDVDVDFDSDDEVAAEEEAEALRLQKAQAMRLSDADFCVPNGGLHQPGKEGDSSGSDHEGVAGALGVRVEGTAAVRCESLGMGLGGEGSREGGASVAVAAARDAPELEAVLGELAAALTEARGRTAPLLHELRGGGLVTAGGLSYLETKHMLLLSYCLSSLFYILLKVEGRPTGDHPVLRRLVEAKTFLEKLRPIDKRLKTQVDKLLRAADAAAEGGEAEAEDPMLFRARPEAFGDAAGEGRGGGGADTDADGGPPGVYRPPKLTAVSMEEDPTATRHEAREARKARASLRRAEGNEFLRELDAELAGAPEEAHGAGDTRAESVSLLKERQRLEARARVEEDMMARVPLSKEQRRSLKAARRASMAGQGILDDFADDVTNAMEPELVEKAYLDKLRLGQKFGGDLSGAHRAAAANGDADLPSKPPLHDRRARYDSVKARQMALAEDAALAAAAPKRQRVEDDVYRAAKDAALAKKAAKAERGKEPELHPPLPDEQTAGPRKVTREILKNRGLTPHRKKSVRNPRKHARDKHGKAETRRKGQVQAVRRSEGPYGGEATGIKARVAKSVRLG